MAKYAEVREKQRHVDAVVEKGDKFNRGVWVGFTFKAKKEAEKAVRDKEDKEKKEEELRALKEMERSEEESLYELF